MNVGDRLAIELQNLYQQGRIDSELGLLKIDYRDRAGEAPLCFDMANGTLHRTGCEAIPEEAASALYAVWQPDPGAEALACPSCKPTSPEGTGMSDDRGADIVYGLVSILDQFGSVLRERGREYRNSSRGRQMTRDFDQLLSTLDQTQHEALQLTLSSLDGLIKVVAQIGDSLNHNSSQNNNQPRDEV